MTRAARTRRLMLAGAAAGDIGSRSGLSVRNPGTVPAETAPLIMAPAWAEAAPDIGHVAQSSLLGRSVGAVVRGPGAANPTADLAPWGWE
ncbi:MAG TPA: hypothetical protein VGX23_11765 [Actinocrinis sp.]|nr:hypothetical protein [Actinocrinis sp.]